MKRRAPAAVFAVAVALLALGGAGWLGPPPPPTEPPPSLTDTLRRDVETLTRTFPGRHVTNPERQIAAGDWIERRLREIGYEPVSEPFESQTPSGPATFRNLIVEVPGTADEPFIVVAGSHYDTVAASPGADDNASGVAVNLALAERFLKRPQPGTLRFEFYANEEILSVRRNDIGSVVRARAAREAGESIAGMLSLEMLGYYTDEPPPERALMLAALAGAEPPEAGDFIAVAAWPASAGLVRRVASAWEGPVPVLPVVAPMIVTDVARSDNWSYWRQGFPAVMVTDTADLRNPHYHQATDAADTLDYERMAAVTRTLQGVLTALAATPPEPAHPGDAP